jgi:drug/metabolite transporter (DMT)-like permease
MSTLSPHLWLGVTLAAAFFQTLRFVLQKHLATATLTPAGATFARFLYSAPLVAALLALYLRSTGTVLPDLSQRFWIFGAVGGFAQVAATICVVKLFKARNFAVGITLKKTEAILAVLVGLIVLGETISLPALGAIVLGVVGVLMLSTPPDVRGIGWAQMANRATGLGLGAGVLFSVSAVCYRGASLEVAVADPLLRAAVTLSAVTAMQLVGMTLWLWWREAGQIRAVWAARRVAVWIGLLSMAGSFCWFTAFTLQTAAFVKAVGQVELIMSLAASVLFFRETVTVRELAGMAVLCVSIVALVLVA